MKLRLIIWSFGITFLFNLNTTYAQVTDSLSRDTLADLEIRMMGLGERMITARDEKERLSSCFHLLKHLNYALKVNGSFQYTFDSVKTISILYSPDSLFRIITWNVVLNSGTFHYYGVLHRNPKWTSSIKDTNYLKPFYPLIDRSQQFKSPMDTTVDHLFWYGAHYYKIVPYTHKKQTHYLLLGWNGNTMMSNKKVVDVLYFERNKPMFGKPVLDVGLPKIASRMVFEFNNDATMTLRYEEKKKYLIYEAVLPPRPQDYGHPETYLPSGSYDYMVFNKKTGVWVKQKSPLADFDMSK
ncbi:MAG: hypothetical protein MUE96_07760 [Bacteroidia bacterium]|jgi:hypothetical protein|nr:hypothetical protein [Bacteroidia bacterium]